MADGWGVCLMFYGCGMDAIHAADHIVLRLFIKQHAAVDTETILGGADFHVQVTLAGKALALDVQGGFAGMRFKKRCQIVNVQHGQYLYLLPAGCPFSKGWMFFAPSF